MQFLTKIAILRYFKNSESKLGNSSFLSLNIKKDCIGTKQMLQNFFLVNESIAEVHVPAFLKLSKKCDFRNLQD